MQNNHKYPDYRRGIAFAYGDNKYHWQAVLNAVNKLVTFDQCKYVGFRDGHLQGFITPRESSEKES